MEKEECITRYIRRIGNRVRKNHIEYQKLLVVDTNELRITCNGKMEIREKTKKKNYKKVDDVQEILMEQRGIRLGKSMNHETE